MRCGTIFRNEKLSTIGDVTGSLHTTQAACEIGGTQVFGGAKLQSWIVSGLSSDRLRKAIRII